MNTQSNAVDTFVDGSKAVLLSGANANRKVINISAGVTPLWYGGNESVRAGTLGNKIIAGARVAVETSADTWVIRLDGDDGLCSYSEEFTGG